MITEHDHQTDEIHRLGRGSGRSVDDLRAHMIGSHGFTISRLDELVVVGGSEEIVRVHRRSHPRR
jgi:hypothetical protein